MYTYADGVVLGSKRENAVDAVSGATLADTAGYVKAVLTAAGK